MSDAREWLATVPRQHTYTDSARMADALLAVLDRCDRLDSDADKMPYLLGTGPYYQGQQAGLMTAVADVRYAIDKALGVTDE